jgi:hypothetical protein
MKPELARQNTGNAGSIYYHYNHIENESVKGLPPFLSLLLMHHRVRSGMKNLPLGTRGTAVRG